MEEYGLIVLVRTLRARSTREPSVAEARCRTDRNAAIRTLSSPLDHRSRHVYISKKRTSSVNIHFIPPHAMESMKDRKYLQVDFHGLAVASHVRQKLRRLRQRKNQQLAVRDLGEEV